MEFVTKVMEVGRGALDETLDGADDERQSPAHRDHPVDHTGNVIDYNEEYARRVGQYLLDRGMILPVLRPHAISDASSTVLVTPPCSTDEEQDIGFASSYESRRTPGSRGRQFEDLEVRLQRDGLRNGVGGARNDVMTTSASHGIYTTVDPASSHASSVRGGRQPQSHQGQSARPHSDTVVQPFSATPDSYYKFTSAEDAEYLSVMQSQILMSSSVSSGSGQRSSANNPQERSAVENDDFQAAKKGTLYLVLDLLIQRARKEKVAKQFLSAPRTQMVQERKRQEESINCDLIFRM